MKTTDKYTLITGASTGLGREFAIACAKRGMNLILVSLPGEQLKVLAEYLTYRYDTNAVYYELDLTRMESLLRLHNQIRNRYSVNMILNNAGFGGSRVFESSPIDYLDRMIQLNVRAVSLLTRLMISELKNQPKAWIMNISSMAAFSPMPYKTLYPATKAFIYCFSRGLAEELKNTRISVCVVHPGPIPTNAEVTNRIMMHGFSGRICLLSAECIANLSLSKMLKGKKVIIPGFVNKLNALLMKWIPLSFRMVLLTRIVKQELSPELELITTPKRKINVSANQPVFDSATGS